MVAGAHAADSPLRVTIKWSISVMPSASSARLERDRLDDVGAAAFAQAGRMVMRHDDVHRSDLERTRSDRSDAERYVPLGVPLAWSSSMINRS